MASIPPFAFDSLQYYDELVNANERGILDTNDPESILATTTSSSSSNHHLNVLPISEGPHSEIAICNFASLLPFTGEESGYIAVELAAAAALAIQHLNKGDDSIVKELDGLPDRCNIRFTLNSYGTFWQEHHAVDAVIQATNIENKDKLEGTTNPCVFLGPIRSAVSMPTSIISGLRGYPQVSPASTAASLDDKSLYPLFGRTIPADEATAVAMISYLHGLGVRYFGVLYINDDYGASFYAALQASIQHQGLDMHIVAAEIPVQANQGDVARAIATLEKSQYRYFVAIVAIEQLEPVVTHAYDQGISGLGSRHTWIYSDSATMLDFNGIPEGSKFYNALQGNGYISVSGGLPDTGRSPRLDTYLDQIGQTSRDTKALDYIRSTVSLPDREMPTVEEIQAGNLVFAETAFAPLMYDAVVAMGLAACRAEKASPNGQEGSTYFTGQEHFSSFKNTTFGGVSGEILFRPDTGTRDPVNRIFHQPNFKRVTVTALDVAKPMVVMLTLNIVLLSLMTRLSPNEWNVAIIATDVFGRVTETQGSCDLTGSIPYLASIAAVDFCCLVFVVVQAYTARNISTEYQESEYIFKCLLVIMLGSFLSFPVLLLTEDNAVAFYFVLAATIGVTTSMILCLIFLPKIAAASFALNTLQMLNRSDLPERGSLYSSQSDGSSRGFGLKILHNLQAEVQLLEKVALLEEQLRQYTEAIITDTTASERPLEKDEIETRSDSNASR